MRTKGSTRLDLRHFLLTIEGTEDITANIRVERKDVRLDCSPELVSCEIFLPFKCRSD